MNLTPAEELADRIISAYENEDGQSNESPVSIIRQIQANALRVCLSSAETANDPYEWFNYVTAVANQLHPIREEKKIFGAPDSD